LRRRRRRRRRRSISRSSSSRSSSFCSVQLERELQEAAGLVLWCLIRIGAFR